MARRGGHRCVPYVPVAALERAGAGGLGGAHLAAGGGAGGAPAGAAVAVEVRNRLGLCSSADSACRVRRQRHVRFPGGNWRKEIHQCGRAGRISGVAPLGHLLDGDREQGAHPPVLPDLAAAQRHLHVAGGRGRLEQHAGRPCRGPRTGTAPCLSGACAVGVAQPLFLLVDKASSGGTAGVACKVALCCYTMFVVRRPTI
mmetsp:Transcript_52234/g.168195  ORF Transcript_52234/g.168195 Transcript_52234/m.168195 type:complete len:200 (+) Transcript_52234:822-1421(+)